MSITILNPGMLTSVQDLGRSATSSSACPSPA